MTQAITPTGFVLDDALLGNLLDDPHRLLPQTVAKDAADLEPLRLAADRIAEVALLDAELDEFVERLGVGDHLPDRLDGPVDLLLAPGLERLLGLVRSREGFFDLVNLILRQLQLRVRAFMSFCLLIEPPLSLPVRMK